MVRLRNVVMAVALGTGAMGCALSQSHVARYSIWHCDECDDFPTPTYGPGNSMMPGTYTGVRRENARSLTGREIVPLMWVLSRRLRNRVRQHRRQPHRRRPRLPLHPDWVPQLSRLTDQRACPAQSQRGTESDLPPLPGASQNSLPVPADRP